MTSRVKAFRITSQQIIAILTGDIVTLALPQGIELERYAHEWQTKSAILILSHPSWDEVPQGHVIPIEDLECQQVPVLT